MISAGGTAEPIDPVRFIGNRSTGKMGVALAEAALDRGARVTLVVGQRRGRRCRTTRRDRPGRDDRRDAATRVLDLVDGGADALIMAAAVADFRPRRAGDDEARAASEGLTLELEPTEDILAGASAAVRARRRAPSRGPILVGFAAETGSLERAAEKLRRKGVDLLVANDVAEAGLGLRDRHEPGHDPRRRTAPSRRCRCSRSARSPTGSSTASRARWTIVTPPRRLNRMPQEIGR